MIIDTHCHLIDQAFAADVDAVIQRSIDADVQKIVLACCDETEFPQIIRLCRRYADFLFPSIGIHPENMADDIDAQFNTLFSDENWTTHKGEIRAVGEIGLDLHWDKSRIDDQRELLVRQICWAMERDLPVLLHIRDAMTEFLELCRTTLATMSQSNGKRLRGILHCYSGTVEQAKESLLYGEFKFGIGGTLTYKKSAVPDVARAIGLERIVLETDAPYLAPVPHRGHRNEPAYTAVTCQALADLFGISADEVARITTANAATLLRL
ncbi:MAG: TatD family deoxyribonuclease [Bacteroidales bacterium]|nr:TatD family deoxyribonuclease [Bacteroidales bacterium]